MKKPFAKILWIALLSISCVGLVGCRPTPESNLIWNEKNCDV